VAALKAHRAKLEAETCRYRSLIRTIDQTLTLEGDSEMDQEGMYIGFAPEKQAEFEAWQASPTTSPRR
jgi:hypothetical protein